MRGKEGNSTTPTKFLPLHFVKDKPSCKDPQFELKLNAQETFIGANKKVVTKLSRRAFFDCEKCIPSRAPPHITPHHTTSHHITHTTPPLSPKGFKES